MQFEKDIEQCLMVLRKGGLILYPTDTIWGIGCDATLTEAVSKIYALKQRPDSKTMIVLVADERDILQFVAAPDPGLFDWLETIDKPTTVIYQGALGFPENLVGMDGSIAIRVVKDEFCRHLIKRLGKPIVSTSANISGKQAPRNFDEIEDAICKGVDYVVKYRRDDRESRQPSAVVKWNGKEGITVIRP